MERLRNIWAILKGMQRRIMAANLSLVAAGGAFFAMLSLFPGLAAVIALLGFLADPGIIDDNMGMLRRFIPEQAYVILDVQIRRLVSANSDVLGWATIISTGAALWSARRGTDAMIQALNTVFRVPQRGGVRAAMTAVAITLALMVVVLTALLTMVFAPVAIAIVPLGSMTEIVLGVLRWLVAIVVVISGIWVLYRYAPNRKGPLSKTPWITPGSMMAIVVWGAASWGFSIYLRNFGSYNEVYGSIGAVIALLMFLYITIFTVLLGATLNAELEPSEEQGPVRPDEPALAANQPAATTSASLGSGSGIGEV